MTRTMYDSITAADIPAGAAMVAGYIDGADAWTAADWALHTDAVRVEIARDPMTNAGHVLDVEAGLATPAEALTWVALRRAAGLAMPAVYCSMSAWPSVIQTFLAGRVPYPLWWLANWTGTQPVLPRGVIAMQYLSDTTGSGGHYDISAVADYWPGVDPPEVNMAELDDVYAQLAGPAPDGQYPGWPTWRINPLIHTPPETSLTLTDLVRAVDRECNSRLPASARSTASGRPDADTLLGHAVSAHAAAEQILGQLVVMQQGLAAIMNSVAALPTGAAIIAAIEQAIESKLAVAGQITISPAQIPPTLP